MKSFLLLISLCICGITNATNYYFSTSIGDDTRTNIQAQNPATPWKTISKLNTFFSSLAAGDSVLFKRGETFYGSIVINKSGTAANSIKIGAYGSGVNPVITGLSLIAGWRSLGSNLWESTAAISTLPTLKMVVINGVNTPMGRYPNISSTTVSAQPDVHPIPGNNGWLNYESCVGNNQFTDNQLAATPNWTGAEVVVKKYNWIVDHGIVTSHSANTITYTPSKGEDDCQAGMSYFIQNDIRTLDEQNEWYYSPSTKKLTIYATTTPNVVQVATAESVIIRNSNNYISISNLDLIGSNSNLADLGAGDNCTGWSITGCSLNFAGRDAIFSNGSNVNCTFSNNSIKDANNNGIYLRDRNGTIVANGNSITNIGIYPGMTDQINGGGASCVAILIQGENGYTGPITIRNNRISHVGYNGIVYLGNNTLVSNNFVEDVCSVKTDGAAIYTWGGDGNFAFTNVIVEDNIVVNGSNKGYIGSALENYELSVNGIYLDGMSNGVIVRRNSISGFNASGIYCNSPVNCIIRDNTVYDCRYAGIHINNINWYATHPLLNTTIKNNIVVAKNLSTYPSAIPYCLNQRCLYYYSTADDLASNIIADSNIYARPIDNDAITPTNPAPNYTQTNYGKWGAIAVVKGPDYIGYGEYGPMYTYTLAGFKTAYPGLEQNTKKSPKTATSIYDLRFEYNETAVTKTISLGATYIDMKGVSYVGTITIPAYSSSVLIKNDATNIPPLANAGADQSYITPVTSAGIIGSGIDYDGTIAAYNWTKISGPAAGTIASATSAVTTATGLVQGIYKFELKVTDNKGATGKDTVTINSGGGTVPVTLVNFTAIAKSGKTLLQWTTVTEINSSHFEVEKSVDGSNFSTIGTVMANGNTTIRMDYQLTDNFPENGINYYRLRIVDIDGQYEYSRVVSVNFKNVNSGSIEIQSSMINNNLLQLNINSTLQQQALVSFYDADGRVIFISNLILQKGMNNFTKYAELASAIYYCKLSTSSEKFTIPLLNGK